MMIVSSYYNSKMSLLLDNDAVCTVQIYAFVLWYLSVVCWAYIFSNYLY